MMNVLMQASKANLSGSLWRSFEAGFRSFVSVFDSNTLVLKERDLNISKLR